jgi:hypothetical protein
LLVALALSHNGTMTYWYGQENVSAARHLWWLAASSIVALTVCLVPRTRAEDLVTIEVVGEIEPKCRLNAFPAGIELGQFSASGTQFVSFQIDCNTPFEYSIRSRDGALTTLGSPVQSMGFVNQIPYMLEARIPTDGDSILDRCGSAGLSGVSPSCGNGNSGNATAIDQTASLIISWAIDAELVAGSYTDVLTLTFGPRL